MKRTIGLASALGASFLLFALMAAGQHVSPPAQTGRLIVTIGHHYGHEPPMLRAEDILVKTPEYDTLLVTSLVPLKGDRAGLELYIVVDNCSSCEAGTKFQELSRFIASQPATTSVGIAYIDNGRISIAVTPTLDRARTQKALNTPAGSKPASPFDPLKELIARWPETTARRAVLMVTNGVNPSAHEGELDASAEGAIEAAQRAGVTVYALYHPSADYATSDGAKIYDGQVQLAHVARDTGGEAYFIGFGPLPSVAPFLEDVADHLANQYELLFTETPGKPGGALQEVTVKTKTGDVELMAPERAWIPAENRGR